MTDHLAWAMRILVREIMSDPLIKKGRHEKGPDSLIYSPRVRLRAVRGRHEATLEDSPWRYAPS